MAAAEFAQGMDELERAKKVRASAGQLRRIAGRPLSGAMGVFYGLGAYGYPLGAITGVQAPVINNPDADQSPLQEGQFDSGAGAPAS